METNENAGKNPNDAVRPTIKLNIPDKFGDSDDFGGDESDSDKGSPFEMTP